MQVSGSTLAKQQNFFQTPNFDSLYTANILNVLCTAFDSVTFPAVIWLFLLQSKTAINVKLHSSMSLSVIGTAVGGYTGCNKKNGPPPILIYPLLAHFPMALLKFLVK